MPLPDRMIIKMMQGKQHPQRSRTAIGFNGWNSWSNRAFAKKMTEIRAGYQKSPYICSRSEKME